MASLKTAFQNLRYGLFAPDGGQDTDLLVQRNLFWLKGLCFAAGMMYMSSYDLPSHIFVNPYSKSEQLIAETNAVRAQIEVKDGALYDVVLQGCSIQVQEYRGLGDNEAVERDVSACVQSVYERMLDNQAHLSPKQIMIAQAVGGLFVLSTLGLGFSAINNAGNAHRRARALNL